MGLKLTEQELQEFLMRSVEKNILDASLRELRFEMEGQIKPHLKKEVKRQLDSFVPDKVEIKRLIEEGVKKEIASYVHLLINKASRGLK